MAPSDQTKPKVKMGVIGVGTMGFNHVRILSELTLNVDLVGIADRDDVRGKQIADNFGTQAFTNHKDLLDQPLDGVIIAVPTKFHKEVVLDAIAAGVAVLVEKPIASTEDEANEIIEAAAAQNVPLLVGHVERFNPAIETLKSRLADENVISISVTRVGPFPQGIGDVGVVLDLGVHDIDLIEYLAGAPIKDVYALTRSADGKLEDTALLQFKTENGILASINTNWITPFKMRQVDVATVGKFVKTDLIGQSVEENSHYDIRGAYTVQPVPVPRAEPLRRELLHFVKCIRGEEQPLVSGEAGMRAIKVALMCLKGQEAATL